MRFPTLLCAIFLTCASSALSSPSTEDARVTYAGADTEDILESALTLHDGVSESDSVAITAYPDLRFTCSGNITSVWFIASERETNTSNTVYPQFLLWRNNRLSRFIQGSQLAVHRGSLKDSRSPRSGAGLRVDISGGEVSLYQYVLEDPMHFESGDILGINQSLQSLLEVWSLSGGGVRNFRWRLWFGRILARAYRPSFGLDLEPLVTLEGTNSSCLEGFLSVKALQLYMETDDQEEDEDEDEDTLPETTTIPGSSLSYVFPSLQVAEDGLLERWLFAADLVRTLSTRPEPVSIELQIWRTVEGRASLNHTSVVSTPNRSGYPNVYEYSVNPPHPVMAGDYVGVRVRPSSSLQPLWHPEDDGTAYHQLPNTGGEIRSSNIAGFAIPLFAAQVKVMEQPPVLQPSSSVRPITSSESSSLSSSLMSATLTTSSTMPISSVSSTTDPIPTASPGPSSATSSTATMPTLLVSSPSPTVSPFSSDETMTNPQTPPDSVARGPSLPVGPRTTNSPPPSRTGGSSSDNNLAAVVAGIVTVVLLLTGAAVIVCILILCLWRRKKKSSSLPRKKSSKSGFFDNPVYDHLQRRLSKDTQIYSTIYDPVYLEVTEEAAGRGPETQYGDGDSGYAELEVKITAPSLPPGGYSQITASPSPCSSPYPRGSPSPRASPCPSPARSATATPVKFTAYHSLTTCPVAEEYLEPRFSENFLRKATCSQDDPEASSCDRAEHEYHELEPPTGGYHRLQHNLMGIYVPTQAERRESVENEDIYTTIEERLYATIHGSSELIFFEERPAYWTPACTPDELYSQLAQNKYREILHSQIKIQHVLGSGNFGEVSKGEWQCEEGPVEVAVKTLKSGSSEEEVVRFLQEAAIMGQFRHPNMVQLLGVVTLAERVMIVLEYLSQGDLGTFLVNRRPTPGSLVPEDTPFLLLGFCRDVASGMEYLQRKAFIHRDLAARNILVSGDTHCKIGDFGMSRDLLDENYYITKGGMVPWRWTAPEALHYRKYSTASDVWSFGCLMYEIWSLGHAPFETLTPQEVVLEKGERLAPPPGCPRGVYSLMIDCWNPEHGSRPSFLHLLKTLASSPGQLLSWSHEDTWGAPEALVLGAPLQTGRKLYPELQQTYTQKSLQ